MRKHMPVSDVHRLLKVILSCGDEADQVQNIMRMTLTSVVDYPDHICGIASLIGALGGYFSSTIMGDSGDEYDEVYQAGYADALILAVECLHGALFPETLKDVPGG